jgi:hypothetical protein
MLNTFIRIYGRKEAEWYGHCDFIGKCDFSYDTNGQNESGVMTVKVLFG